MILSLNNAHEGYNYQDLLTSYFILKEALQGNFESIFTVDKKHTSSEEIPDRFDDLVIKNGNKIQRKQIKYSNDKTLKTLEKNDLANDNGPKIAIYKLFETWCDLKTSETEFRLCLAWNEPVDDDIKIILQDQLDNYSFDTRSTKVFKINLDKIWESTSDKIDSKWSSFRKYVKDNNVDRNLFTEFCENLLIEVELPKASLDFSHPSSLENILISQAEKLGIGKYPNEDIYVPDFLERLAKLAGVYRTTSREVAVSQVLQELRLKTNFGEIEQKFEIDQDKNINLTNNGNDFLNQILENKKSILIAEPGAGKSWFLTNFIEHLEKSNQKVIRHYCFTSTNDSLSEKRVTSDVFFGNLIGSLQKYFPNIILEKESLFAANLHELNLILSKIHEPLTIIIDGLDHIERTLRNETSLAVDKTRIIEFISQIILPSNITILLSSQPVDEIQILISDHDYKQIALPYWNISNTQDLMQRFQIDDNEIEDEKLSSFLLRKSQGNPLYLTYVLKNIEEQTIINKNILNNIPDYDFNLASYYEYLSKQLEDTTLTDILACLEFSVTEAELKEIIPQTRNLGKNLKILKPVITQNISRGGIRLYHDSFRRFIIEKLSSETDFKETYKLIISWLNDKGFYTNAKSYRYLLGYLIKNEQYEDVLPFANLKFLSESLFHGYSESVINVNYKNFVEVAIKLQDWCLFIYLSELSRTIATTNIEDYHSAFLDNFEIYFETFYLLYGFEKAYSLLFFNGEKTYDDKVIAKAFCILQRYGYILDWQIIDRLFVNEITDDNFKFYVFSIVEDEEQLKNLFTDILEDNTFLSIFIDVLVELKKIDKFFSFYEVTLDNKEQNVAKRINKILLLKDISTKINIIENEVLGVSTQLLDPLSLDFVGDFIRSVDMHKFYIKVSEYAKKDMDSLINFEKGIPSHNFFYNWIKFFIRQLIIENTAKQVDLEQETLENIKFLASDVNQYKGKPRVVDFTYENGGIINLTIKKALKNISSKQSWKTSIEELIKIPYNTIAIVESDFANNLNIEYILNAYQSFGQADDLDYPTYAEYSFKKAFYLAKLNMRFKAESEFRKALKYLSSYTSRKDTTLDEIINPIEYINDLDNNLAKDYVKKLKHLSDAVDKHTEDGKGIRWLKIHWFQQLIKVDYFLAGQYLIYQLLDEPYYWKLEYMFVDFLKASQKVNPIILNFLYRILPTNNTDDYLEGFLNIIPSIECEDHQLAKSSIIDLLIRDWNDSYNSLEIQTTIKFQNTVQKFGLSFDIKQRKQDDFSHVNHNKLEISEKLFSEILCIEDSIKDYSIPKLSEYYGKKEAISESDLNNLYFYLQELSNDEITALLVLSLIRIRFPREATKHYDKLFDFIQRLEINEGLKITLLVNNFVSSKDGWYSRFVHIGSLEQAIAYNKVDALDKLAKYIGYIYPTSDYMPNTTSNLIIAFKEAGIDSEIIFNMYDMAFDYIQDRLSDNNEFDWKSVENTELSYMTYDELAITLLLSKSKNYDSSIQRTVLSGISYLLDLNSNLLVKPIKWFLNNFNLFNPISVAGILEFFLVELRNHRQFLMLLKDEFTQLNSCENLYIRNNVSEILEGLSDE